MKVRSVVILVTSMLAVSACNIKLKGDKSSPPPENKGVPGPDLRGTWLSNCESNPRTAGYRTLDVTYTNSNVSRVENLYHDATCNLLSKTEVKSGTYKFIEALKDGSFTVEYTIPIGNGWSSLPKENVRLENGMLYLSDFVIGQGINKSMMVPLHRKEIGK